MKKQTLLVCLYVFGSICLHAQIKVGAFAGIGSQHKLAGLGVNGEFFAHKKLSVAPNVLAYFPRQYGNINRSA